VHIFYSSEMSSLVCLAIGKILSGFKDSGSMAVAFRQNRLRDIYKGHTKINVFLEAIKPLHQVL